MENMPQAGTPKRIMKLLRDGHSSGGSVFLCRWRYKKVSKRNGKGMQFKGCK